MDEPQVVGFNPDADLYYMYLDEFYHGLTESDYEDWKQEILEEDDDIDWELMDMALELAEEDDLKEQYEDCRTK